MGGKCECAVLANDERHHKSAQDVQVCSNTEAPVWPQNAKI